MKIKYLSCDGETEVEEEIINADFFEHKHWKTGQLIQFMICTRPDYDNFEVLCKNVRSIKA